MKNKLAKSRLQSLRNDVTGFQISEYDQETIIAVLDHLLLPDPTSEMVSTGGEYVAIEEGSLDDAYCAMVNELTKDV